MNTIITIRPLDVASDTELTQLIALEAAGDKELFGGTIPKTPAQRRVRLTPTEYWTGRDWVAVAETLEGGEMIVGHAELMLPLQENREQANIGLQVHPAFRNQGVGTALVEQALIPALLEEGRSTVSAYGEVPAEGDPKDPALPWNRIAARLGLTVKNIEIARVCDLPVPAETLEHCEARAAEKLGEYRIEVWEDAVPEEHLEAYGLLLRQLELDVPEGDFETEAAQYPPERIRAMEERRRAAGNRVLTAVAIAPDGTFAGNSELHISENPGTTLAYQENTLVMPEHRGHRLGLALKTATHRRVSELFPDLRVIATWNSAINPWMIAVNEALGYRIVYRENAYQGSTPSRD